MGVHDTGIVGASIARPAVTSIEFAENQCESEEPAARTANGRPYNLQPNSSVIKKWQRQSAAIWGLISR